MRKHLLVIALLSVSFFACTAKPFLTRPALEKEGAVFVYLAPFPQDAQRLSFRLSGLYAKREDGEQIPLVLSLREVNGREAGRERLFAFGDLPPGQYAGLSLRVEKASLSGEEGEAALRLPQGMADTSVPFTVERKRAVVLSLMFLYRESVREGFQFSPVFSARVPARLAAGQIGLASSRGGNTVTMFNKVSGAVISVIPTGTSPAGMAMDVARRRAYVAISGEDAVEVIDLLEAGVIDRVRLAGGDNPAELALTPDGRTLFSANPGSNTVSVIDPSSLLETDRIPVGAGPQSVLVDRTGRKAYVFNALSSTISVIDVPRGIVTGTFSAEAVPARGQLSRDGSRLYVLQQGSPYVSVLDTVSLSVTKRIYVGSGATWLKVDPQTDYLYIGKRNSDVIDVYDPFSLLPVDVVRAGGEAGYITIDAEGSNLFVVLPAADRVRIVRLISKKTAAEIDVGEDPYWVTLMGER